MSNIKDTIRALLARAKSSEFENEKLTCLKQVERLLAKHAMSLDEVGADPESVIMDKAFATSYRSRSWTKHLLSALARYYGCQLMTTRNGSKLIYTVAGRDSAVETLRLMWPFVLEQVKGAAYGLRDEDGGTLDSHMRMIANALSVRVSGLTKDKPARKRAYPTAFALTPVDEIEALWEKHFAGFKMSKPVTLGTRAAAKAAAGRISINRQTKSDSARRRIGGK